jgi:hypothetical protein
MVNKTTVAFKCGALRFVNPACYSVSSSYRLIAPKNSGKLATVIVFFFLYLQGEIGIKNAVVEFFSLLIMLVELKWLRKLAVLD